jgi:hypothetical protein
VIPSSFSVFLMLLFMDARTNQSSLFEFFFHVTKGIITAQVTDEKNLFLTAFTPRKSFMWKNCGFVFSMLAEMQQNSPRFGLTVSSS